MSKDRAAVDVVSDEIDMGQIASLLWFGKSRIVLTTFLTLVAGLIWVIMSPPVYQADALLQIESKKSGLSLPTGMQDLLGGEDPRTLTEIDILRSRLVLGKVVDQLALDVSAAPLRLPLIGETISRLDLPHPSWLIPDRFGWNTERIVVGELEVPDDWIGEPMIVTATGNDGYTVSLPDGSERTGQLRKRLADNRLGLALRIDVLDGAEGRGFEVMRRAPQVAVEDLRSQFSAMETGRQSSVLRLILSGHDPEQVTRVLDAVAQTYLAQNISRSSAEAERSLAFIDEQLPLSEQAVAEAQNALNSYRQKQQSVDLTYETQALLETATEIERKLSELALQEEELKRQYTINHPTYQSLLENKAQLTDQLAKLRDESGKLPETQKEVFNLTRDLEVAQQVYLQLLNRSQELQVVRASSIGSVRILDSAQAGLNPVSPKKSLIMSLAIMIGLMIGTGWVLGRHFLRHGVQSSEELEKLGLAVFATIGHSPDAVGHRDSKGYLPILAVSNPTDLAVEAFRSLRTSLHFGMLDAKTNSVVMTSSAPGAGKSFNSVNLAVVAAQAGQRVCLIDADLRRGYLRRYFRLERNIPGLAELLAGDKTLAEVLHRGPVDTLDFMSCGRYPPNPSELLMRPTFEKLLETLNQTYDLIVLDAPPTLAVTDPVIMARSAGATILVVRHTETALGEVQAVQRAFDTAGARITGALLNGYRAQSGGRPDYQNYRYAYTSGEKDH
ncbi:polysaccharide biosynthesis tyrosine autokinase [Rhodobacter ferrooxidans]|uniref:Capsular exopolysaccharide family n=1 Tax=Rhodobacter ferrooxidans TaxID=371731 RepID=C8S2T3_9RHOB|nr:polysaccharide biosynthesis tyrosine autokinase [Rhodobacter sp. SW2]EEW24759.1 capsular exopolysaccharide family [Rhodobacter sp. SW2]